MKRPQSPKTSVPKHGYLSSRGAGGGVGVEDELPWKAESLLKMPAPGCLSTVCAWCFGLGICAAAGLGWGF